MNWQMQYLANLIKSAQLGSEGSTKVLRVICQKAADAAPADDVIRMAQFLLDLRAEAARLHAESN